MAELLTRDKFRNSVFNRDEHKCVICDEPAVDSHHIIDRRIWGEEGNWGYYLDNGASLCSAHHFQAEETILSCDEIRKAAGICNIILPDHYDNFDKYDKWGNIILSNGKRVPGELFSDKSVQKILSKVLNIFTNTRYIKAPRTSHLPWSASKTSDDRTLDNVDHLFNQKIVVTIKMDGESTTCYKDHMHARSLDSDNHSSRDWMKNFHAQFAHDIPENWRIVGENLFAKHSIYYSDLPTYFLVHSIWDENNECLNWINTTSWCHLLGLQTVPIVMVGKVKNEKCLRDYVEPKVKDHEGYVVRPFSSFGYKDYNKKVGKYVRANHVNSTHNWKHTKIIPNLLKKNN